MDNFRRRTRDNQHHAIDGILHTAAAARSQGPRRPFGRRPIAMDGLRSPNSRKVDDFKRPEGYHAAQSNGARVVASAPGSTPNPSKADRSSLLHMTLPSGGVLSPPKKKERASAKHGKQSRFRTIRKWTLRSALALTVLTLLIGGVLVAKGLLKINKVFKGGGTAAALQSEVKPELLKGEGDGRVNILLLGRGGGEHAGPDLTDTILVASIDPVNKTASLVSIPRDLWVTVPGYGSTKINAVFANAKYRAVSKGVKDKQKSDEAGAQAIEDTVGNILGIPIHYYGIIDFEAFKQAVDTVGGVDINVPAQLAVSELLWDETSGKNYYLNVKAGMQHFDGQKALLFTRTRHTSTRGDFDRTERQRLFIQALGQKVLSAGTYTNPLKISQLMSAFGDHIALDLSPNNALRLAQIGKTIDLSKMKSIGLADPPNNFVRTDTINNLSVVRPTAGFGDYSQIQNFMRNTLKDPYLAKENATVMVLNGTNTPGLATTKADQLKSYGYNVIKVDDAPTHDYAATTLIDMTQGKKPFTRSYLEKRLNVKSTTRLPDATIQTQGVDFVIILGQDS